MKSAKIPTQRKNTPSRGTLKKLHHLITISEKDEVLRSQLVADPKGTIEQRLHIRLPEDHDIITHERSKEVTHLVLPPKSETTEEEREAARTGRASLEYLRRTMSDPAPDRRPEKTKLTNVWKKPISVKSLIKKINYSIDQGLAFIESTLTNNGAWHCIRYNIADPEIPRHYERPPFVSAYCTLALESCSHSKAQRICSLAKKYIVDTMEFPGLWRYYRHLPQDLDSTTLCSLVISDHPWIAMGQNLSRILSNPDEQGCFNTWFLAPDEPDVVLPFRMEADPVVNANVISLLGNCQETKGIQKWLESLLKEKKLDDSSKWYPDNIAICYGIARAVNRTQPALDHFRPLLADYVMESQDKDEVFGNVLQTAQAITTLYAIGHLNKIDLKRCAEFILGSQHTDGSWPELLAFGDQKLMWGMNGQIGHASESMTSAFCIEALVNLLDGLMK